MPRIAYIDKTFHGKSKAVIQTANQIIGEYEAAGFVLTLRQLYYQMVARGYIPNRDSEYRKLGNVINDARLAGLIDWTAIEDRTRVIKRNYHLQDPAHAIDDAAGTYQIDMWANQPCRVEVWIEKDALMGIIEAVCRSNDVPHFSCRGYTSQSSMWRAGQRALINARNGQLTQIIHLGDHDPSGIDMTRDIEDRMQLFTGSQISVNRIALNMDQVEQYDPPPNPAKLTDTRSTDYIDRFGDESWELDALEPQVIVDLIQEAIDDVKDHDVWGTDFERMETDRELLQRASARWTDLTDVLEGDE